MTERASNEAINSDIKVADREQIIKKMREASSERYPSNEDVKGDHSSALEAIEERAKELFDEDEAVIASGIYEVRQAKELAETLDAGTDGVNHTMENSQPFADFARVHEALLRIQGDETAVANFRVLALDMLGVDVAKTLEAAYPSVFPESKGPVESKTEKKNQEFKNAFGDSDNFDIDSVQQLLKEAGIEDSVVLDEITMNIGALDEAIRNNEEEAVKRLSEQYGVLTAALLYDKPEQLAAVDMMLSAVVGDASTDRIMNIVQEAITNDRENDAKNSLNRVFTHAKRSIKQLRDARESAIESGNESRAEDIAAEIDRIERALALLHGESDDSDDLNSSRTPSTSGGNGGSGAQSTGGGNGGHDGPSSGPENPGDDGENGNVSIEDAINKIMEDHEYKGRINALGVARDEFARLSLQGGFRLELRSIFGKTSNKEEQLNKSKEHYDKAVESVYKYVKEQLQNSGVELTQDDINKMAIFGAVEERLKFAQAQEEVLNESKYRKFVEWYAKKGKLAKFAINLGAGAAAAVAAGGLGAGAAFTGVAIAGSRWSRALLANRGKNSFAENSAKSGENFGNNVVEFEDEINTRELSSSIMKQLEDSREDTRAAYAKSIATVLAGSALGGLLAGHSPNFRLPDWFGGDVDAEAGKSIGEFAPKPEDVLPPDSVAELFVDHVEYGEGITHTLRDLAQSKGIEGLSGSDLYNVYEQFEPQLSELAGTYDMGDGDFGILSPGRWEIPAELAEELEEAMREKLANR